MEKREVDRRLNVAMAEMEAQLGPSAAMMRKLFEQSPEVAEFMKTKIFK